MADSDRELLIAHRNAMYGTVAFDSQGLVVRHVTEDKQSTLKTLPSGLYYVLLAAGILDCHWRRGIHALMSVVCGCVIATFLYFQFSVRMYDFPEESLFSLISIVITTSVTYFLPFIFGVLYLRADGFVLLFAEQNQECGDGFVIDASDGLHANQGDGPSKSKDKVKFDRSLSELYEPAGESEGISARNSSHVSNDKFRKFPTKTLRGAPPLPPSKFDLHPDSDYGASKLKSSKHLVHIHYVLGILIICLLTLQWLFHYKYNHISQLILVIFSTALTTFITGTGMCLFSLVCCFHRSLAVQLVESLRWKSCSFAMAVKRYGYMSRLLRDTVLRTQSIFGLLVTAQIWDVLANIISLVEVAASPWGSSVRGVRLTYTFVIFIVADIVLATFWLVTASRVSAGFNRVRKVTGLLRIDADPTSSFVTQLDSFLTFLHISDGGFFCHGVKVDASLLAKLVFSGAMVLLVMTRLAVNITLHC